MALPVKFDITKLTSTTTPVAAKPTGVVPPNSGGGVPGTLAPPVKLDPCGMPIPPEPQVQIGEYFSLPAEDFRKAAKSGEDFSYFKVLGADALKYMKNKWSDMSAAATKRQLAVAAAGINDELNPKTGQYIPNRFAPPMRPGAGAPPPTRPDAPPPTRPGAAPPPTRPTSTPVRPGSPQPYVPTTAAEKAEFEALKDPSVTHFLKLFPDFTLEYNANQIGSVTVPLKPTWTEQAFKGGMKSLVKRGGYLLYKPALEGIMPIASTEPPQESDNHVWGVFLVPQTYSSNPVITGWLKDLTWIKPKVPPTPEGTKGYRVVFHRFDRGAFRILAEAVDDTIDALKSAIKWICSGITRDDLQMAANVAAAVPNPYVMAAAAAWKTAGAACNYAWPSVSDTLTQCGGGPITPPVPKYPAGSVGYFNKKAGMWKIAVPPVVAGVGTFLAGTALFTEAATEMIIPDGVTPVTFWQYQKLTLPWFKRLSTYIASGVSFAALAGGGGYVLVKRRKLKQLTGW